MAATHAVLIRAINVGGRNKVPMADLRAALDAEGLGPVRTYIQSGNALVEASDLGADEVTAVVERVLLAAFDVDTVVVTVDAATLRGAVEGAPAGFGSEPDVYHSDVAFLRPGVEASDAAAAFSLRDGVDALWEGDGVIYFRRLSAQRTKSRMSSVMGTPMYKEMTIRNWATTTTLVGMLDA